MNGIIGGTSLLKSKTFARWTEQKIETPYGDTHVRINGNNVFIQRHGNPPVPPHKINYRANVFAMKELGVKQIFSPCAAGSLQPHVIPGDFVICDQFVDRTNSRIDTFYDGPHTTHISTAMPYCPDLRKIVIKAAVDTGIKCHETGTVVVIQGPRFSTIAESRWYSGQGWEVINMTQYPEVTLARELEICFVNISLITDYDAGLEGNSGIKPVSIGDVVKIFKENNEKIKNLLFRAIPEVASKRKCICSSALKGAVLS